MDKAYMLNSYVNDLEQSTKEFTEAEEYKNKFQFRINGSKSIPELKKQVNIFLDKNDVDPVLKDRLSDLRDSLTDDANLYRATVAFEEIINTYLDEKEKKQIEDDEEVDAIKEDLLARNVKRLKEAGIAVDGSIDSLKEKINSEDDVLRFERNIDQVEDYYYESTKNGDDVTVAQISAQDLDIAVESSDEQEVVTTIVDDARIERDNQPLTVVRDGIVEIEANSKNSGDMNYVNMMTMALVSNQGFMGYDMDMKFVKDGTSLNDFKVAYGNFSNGDMQFDPSVVNGIRELANSYDPNISYSELLASASLDLKLALQIASDNAFDKLGDFKFAVKQGENGRDIKFGMDENYQDVVDSFRDNDAYTTVGVNGDAVVMVPNSPDQNVILYGVDEGLRRKRYEDEQEQEKQLEPGYQKKLVLDSAANIHSIFLIVIMVADILLLLSLIYIFMK